MAGKKAEKKECPHSREGKHKPVWVTRKDKPWVKMLVCRNCGELFKTVE